MNRPTLLLQLSVKPVAGTDAAEQASGGFANVWVLAEDEMQAIAQAQQLLASSGWSIVAKEAPTRRVGIEDFPVCNDARARFEQCQTDEVVVQLHTWRDEH